MNHRKVNASLITKFFLFALCLALILATGNFKSGLTQGTEVRKLNVQAFSGIPLKVKEVRNLQEGEDWFRDLEIEVENISDKPIYFIYLIIKFPDIESPHVTRADGTIPSKRFGLTFGVKRLWDLSSLATPDDPSIKPGETYVFKIPEYQAQHFESLRKDLRLLPAATNKIAIQLKNISFGDGTGYRGQRMLYSKKKSDEGVQ